jgi:hypothetical protein
VRQEEKPRLQALIEVLASIDDVVGPTPAQIAAAKKKAVKDNRDATAARSMNRRAGGASILGSATTPVAYEATQAVRAKLKLAESAPLASPFGTTPNFDLPAMVDASAATDRVASHSAKEATTRESREARQKRLQETEDEFQRAMRAHKRVKTKTLDFLDTARTEVIASVSKLPYASGSGDVEPVAPSGEMGDWMSDFHSEQRRKREAQ